MSFPVSELRCFEKYYLETHMRILKIGAHTIVIGACSFLGYMIMSELLNVTRKLIFMCIGG